MSTTELAVYTRVTHPTYGAGIVTAERDQSVIVLFDDGESRQIADQYLTLCTAPVQTDQPVTSESVLEAAIDLLIDNLRAFRLRTQPVRLAEGRMLYELRVACAESRKRDWTGIVTEKLGYKRQTAYDLIHEYEDTLTPMAAAQAQPEEEQPSSSASQPDESQAEPSTESAEAVDADEALTPASDSHAYEVKTRTVTESAKRKNRNATRHLTEVRPPALTKLAAEDVQAHTIYREHHEAAWKAVWLFHERQAFNEIVGRQRALEAQADAAAHYEATDADLPAELREEQGTIVHMDDVVLPTLTGEAVYPAQPEGA